MELCLSEFRQFHTYGLHLSLGVCLLLQISTNLHLYMHMLQEWWLEVSHLWWSLLLLQKCGVQVLPANWRMLLVCPDFLWKGPFLEMNLYVLKAPEVFPCVVIFIQSPHLKCVSSPCFYLQYSVYWNFSKPQQSLVQEPILVMGVDVISTKSR